MAITSLYKDSIHVLIFLIHDENEFDNISQTMVQPMAVAPTTTVVIQQGPQKPSNYMVLAVLTTFFCNPLFGCIAWILSCLSDSAYDEGESPAPSISH